jgi:hypothetical protein
LSAIAIGESSSLPENGSVPRARTVIEDAGGGVGLAARIERSGDEDEAVGSLHAFTVNAKAIRAALIDVDFIALSR